MKLSAAVVSGLLVAAPLYSGRALADETPVVGTGSYGQQLVEQTLAAHRNVVSITLYAKVTGRPGDVVVASNVRRSDDLSPAEVRAVVKTGKPRFQVERGQLNADLPQFDMQHKPAGALSLVLRMEPGAGLAEMEDSARAVRYELSRRISYEANLVQAAQMDPNVPLRSYAQHLADQTLLRHPDVLIVAIHAKTPKNADPEILASNIGRIGKKADDDDMRVVRDGKTNLEINKELQRYEVELPLNDVSGVRIGALGVVFPLDAHTDQKAKHAEAMRIRDEISHRILTPGNLVEAWPYDPHYSENTYAQALVDKTLAKHPDIQVLALHVTPPSTKTNVILASNIGRIGKVADSDDMRVVNTGKPDMAVNAEGDRFETELALRDHSGMQIGAVSIVYGYAKGDDKSSLARKANVIGGELASNIPSAAALFAKVN